MRINADKSARMSADKSARMSADNSARMSADKSARMSADKTVSSLDLLALLESFCFLCTALCEFCYVATEGELWKSS